MRKPEAPLSPLDVTMVGLLPDEGGSLIPLTVGDIPLVDLPQGIELRHQSLRDLNDESRDLLIQQIKESIKIGKESLEANTDRIYLRNVNLAIGSVALVGMTVAEYYMIKHGIPHSNTGDTGEGQFLAGLFGYSFSSLPFLAGLADRSIINQRRHSLRARTTHLEGLLSLVSEYHSLSTADK